MSPPMTQLAERISRLLISSSRPTGKWNTSLEQALHHLGCRHSLTHSLVARVIHPLLQGHHSLALGFFHWASQQPTFSHNSLTFGTILKSLSNSRHLYLIHKLLKDAKARRIHLDLDVYRSIIASNLQANNSHHAFSIFKTAVSLNSDLGPDTCNSLLAALASDGNITDARQLFDEMTRASAYTNTLGFGVFMWKFCGNASVVEILSLLDEARKGQHLLINGSIVATLVVHGLCQKGRTRDAFWILEELRTRECKPDFISYRIVTEGFRQERSIVDVQMVLKKKRKLGVSPRANDYRLFLLELISENRIKEANELGQIIVSGNFPIDEGMLNTLMESVSTVDPPSSIFFLESMITMEKLPPISTLTILCKNLCEHGKINEIMEIFKMLSTKEYFCDLESYLVMVSYLCKAGKVREAYEIIKEMKKKKGISPDLSFYNCILEACCREDLLRPAKRLWDEMFANGCPGNLTTYNILIHKFSEIGQIDEGQRLYSQMMEKGIKPDQKTYKYLIEGLCKERKPEVAIQQLFYKCIDQESILATFIQSLCEQGCFKVAASLLCNLPSDMAASNCHLMFLKASTEAGELQCAREHLKWIGGNSPSLLDAITSEYTEPMLDLFQIGQAQTF